MNREQIIRDVAYAIWEAEGRPEGRDEAHWREAQGQVSTGVEAGAMREKTKAAPRRKAVAAAKE